MLNLVKDWDEFAEEVKLKFTKDRDAMGSLMGVMLTALMYAMTAVFLYSKTMVLAHKSDVSVTRNVKEGEYTYNDTFSGE